MNTWDSLLSQLPIRDWLPYDDLLRTRVVCRDLRIVRLNRGIVISNPKVMTLLSEGVFRNARALRVRKLWGVHESDALRYALRSLFSKLLLAARRGYLQEVETLTLSYVRGLEELPLYLPHLRTLVLHCGSGSNVLQMLQHTRQGLETLVLSISATMGGPQLHCMEHWTPEDLIQVVHHAHRLGLKHLTLPFVGTEDWEAVDKVMEHLTGLRGCGDSLEHIGMWFGWPDMGDAVHRYTFLLTALRRLPRLRSVYLSMYPIWETWIEDVWKNICTRGGKPSYRVCTCRSFVEGHNDV